MLSLATTVGHFVMGELIVHCVGTVKGFDDAFWVLIWVFKLVDSAMFRLSDILLGNFGVFLLLGSNLNFSL